MPSDTYTKVILTVIAASLLWLCAIGSGRALHAQPALPLAAERPQPVIIVGWGTVDARGRITLTMRGDRDNATTDPNIPVKLVGDRLEYSDANPLPVSISQIKRTGQWEPIRSAVEEEPVRSRPGQREK